MPQSSAPIVGVNLSDADWRDLFGDEAGVLSDLDGSAYAISLPTDSDVAAVGSPTQRSTARVAGFVHRIPAGETEPVTVPAASGSARTDIVALRYDPAFTGEPGPVRLARIEGATTALPVYDDAPPGVEDLPLWAVTRQPGQALSQATVQDLRPRTGPSLNIPAGGMLPASSPLGSVAWWKGGLYRRVLGSASAPAWVRHQETSVAAVSTFGTAFRANPFDPLRVVRADDAAHLTGLVFNRASVTDVAGYWFTLPDGFRPEFPKWGGIAYIEGGALAEYHIETNGQVHGVRLFVGAYPVPDPRYWSFDMTYQAA